jgi:hypothetical protein
VKIEPKAAGLPDKMRRDADFAKGRRYEVKPSRYFASLSAKGHASTSLRAPRWIVRDADGALRRQVGRIFLQQLEQGVCSLKQG